MERAGRQGEADVAQHLRSGAIAQSHILETDHGPTKGATEGPGGVPPGARMDNAPAGAGASTAVRPAVAIALIGTTVVGAARGARAFLASHPMTTYKDSLQFR
ncbi:hypothetical protein GCM10022293_42890 [Azospirillum formosense]